MTGSGLGSGTLTCSREELLTSFIKKILFQARTWLAFVLYLILCEKCFFLQGFQVDLKQAAQILKTNQKSNSSLCLQSFHRNWTINFFMFNSLSHFSTSLVLTGGKKSLATELCVLKHKRAAAVLRLIFSLEWFTAEPEQHSMSE